MCAYWSLIKDCFYLLIYSQVWKISNFSLSLFHRVWRRDWPYRRGWSSSKLKTPERYNTFFLSLSCSSLCSHSLFVFIEIFLFGRWSRGEELYLSDCVLILFVWIKGITFQYWHVVLPTFSSDEPHIFLPFFGLYKSWSCSSSSQYIWTHSVLN